MARRILSICGGLLALGAAGAPALSAGPDVIVSDLNGVTRYSRVGNITAYSVGTTSCNIGNADLQWDANTSNHPVIAQNLYRLKIGRFEQIGMSWLKHGFAATNENECGSCIDPGTTQLLGPSCSDPYSSGLNGNQTLLGARSEVNAATGVFPFPYTSYPINSALDFRLQVHDADIQPSLNAGALYFIEGQYVTADDAAAGNDNNNASYRPVTVFEQSPPSTLWFVLLAGTTQQQKPAIQAWKDTDSSVTLTNVDVPGDGRVIIASKATALANGFYRYEYAVQNLNSNRCVGSFSIPLNTHTLVRNIGFHDVDYHSGELYSLTDWTGAVAGGVLTWATQTYATNQNANALRWATLYNFRFDANVVPVTNTQITLGLFRPGFPGTVVVSTFGPSTNPPDCQPNGVPDFQDIANMTSQDLNTNTIPDECETDCNQNGHPDDYDITQGAQDCDSNTVPDVCQLPIGDPAPGGPFFCTSNCSPDCNHNGRPDSCDIANGTDPDCNSNGIPDSCDIAQGTADCNSNGIPDSCEIAGGSVSDCNENGIIDTCAAEFDCNSNGIPDDCEQPNCPGILRGDMDCNGVINLADMPAFIQAILKGGSSCRADMNGDRQVNGRDIQLFVNAIH